MKILIPVLVGSLIGYMTNWLAIKMLFKPHYEKKIFGIPIPFTPGLIPKERERMSKNIGQTVGTHLLSADTIIKAISDSENERKIKAWINEKIESLRHNDSTLDEYLESKITSKYKTEKNKITKKISDYIIDFVRKEEFKSSLNKLIDENIEKYNTDTIYKNIKVNTKIFIEKLRDSDDLKLELEKYIYNILEKGSSNEKKIEEVLPEDVFNSIDKYLLEYKDEIGDNIRDILKDKDVKEKIQYTMANVIFDRSNKLLMALISPDVISEKIFESLEKYIEKRETNDDIIEVIKFIIEKIKIKKVSDISNNLNKVIDEISLDSILDKFINNILRDANIDNSIESLIGILNQKENSSKQILKNYLWNEIDRIIASEYIEAKISASVESTMTMMGNKQVSALFIKLNDDIMDNIYNFSKKIFNRFAAYELPKIIEMLNVSKIVEDKINSFEIDYTEKLILDIARKELNQITRLGALLGGLLGLLSPLLQYIY